MAGAMNLANASSSMAWPAPAQGGPVSEALDKRDETHPAS